MDMRDAYTSLNPSSSPSLVQSSFLSRSLYLVIHPQKALVFRQYNADYCLQTTVEPSLPYKSVPSLKESLSGDVLLEYEGLINNSILQPPSTLEGLQIFYRKGFL